MPDPAVSLCPSPAALAARIRSERERAGLTQREAAAILGIAHQSYGQYETAKTYPKLPTLFALVEALDFDPRALLPEWFAAGDHQIYLNRPPLADRAIR